MSNSSTTATPAAISIPSTKPTTTTTTTTTPTTATAAITNDDMIEFSHSADSVLQDWKIYKPLPGSNTQQALFETVALSYPSSSALTAASAEAPQELFPLCEPTRANEYLPLHDLKATVQIIIKYCLDDTERVPFGDELNGILRAVIRACNRKDVVGLRESVGVFNEQLNVVRENRRIKLGSTMHEKNRMNTDPAPLDLIYHILDQTYAHTVAPQVDSLQKYKGFSNNVYGEVKHSLVTEFIAKTNLLLPLSSSSTTTDAPQTRKIFLDMGSGTGNVVLQVAAQTLAESYGIEIMENPSKLAQLQAQEFKSRCRLYNIPHGPVEIFQGDFLEDERINPLLAKADVVFVNNYAFDASLNFSILQKFLDLKEGCVVISLKLFGSGGVGENSLENMFRTREYYFGENRVSWMAEGGRYYIHTVKR
ncbi:histone methylation protein DOT1-domain-containing protein [Obelidium mucronatum]|nr:histone methylation protein DOT1-domain-containing protein [Obelidium mucronatum]